MLGDFTGLQLVEVLQRVQPVRLFCFWEVPTKEAEGVVWEDFVAKSKKLPSFPHWAASLVHRGLQVQSCVPLLQEGAVAGLAHAAPGQNHRTADVGGPVRPNQVTPVGTVQHALVAYCPVHMPLLADGVRVQGALLGVLLILPDVVVVVRVLVLPGGLLLELVLPQEDLLPPRSKNPV